MRVRDASISLCALFGIIVFRFSMKTNPSVCSELHQEEKDFAPFCLKYLFLMVCDEGFNMNIALFFSNCSDYDLCEKCETVEGVHDETHIFVKIYKPAVNAGRKNGKGKMKPLLKENIYTHEEKKQ